MALTKLTTDLIDSTIVTSINGSTGAVTLETGTDWQATPKTADFTAVAGEGYFVDTTSAAITVTLPSSPTAGDEINLVDYAGTANTNNITITSSDNINGSSDDVLIDYERGGVSMVYVDATQGWIAYNAANETATALDEVVAPLTVDYLVVAGGGGCGRSDTYYGGGGGGGGFRTSISSDGNGGGASAETAFSALPQTNYTLTVGAGGPEGASNTDNGSPGSDSVLSTITSTGGGGGGKADTDGGSGGSGGGGGGNDAANSGGAAVSPTQGYAGGGTASAVAIGGGGGGGAGSIGTSSTSGGAAGGAAKASTITGPSVYFSAGGGGKRGYYSASNGAAGSNWRQTNSGCGGTPGVAGEGGQSGIVILRYSNAYSITINSGLVGSTTTSGSDKITTFTAGTGTITFS